MPRHGWHSPGPGGERWTFLVVIKTQPVYSRGDLLLPPTGGTNAGLFLPFKATAKVAPRIPIRGFPFPISRG